MAKPPQYINFPGDIGAGGGGSLIQGVGFRFALGAGLSTLIAAVWICSAMTHDYPATIACGGTAVPVIQVIVALASLWARKLLTAGPLEERSRYLTIIAGAASSALVFGLPPLVARVNSSDEAARASTAVPLIAFPIVASIVALKRGTLPAAAPSQGMKPTDAAGSPLDYEAPTGLVPRNPLTPARKWTLIVVCLFLAAAVIFVALGYAYFWSLGPLPG